jgi:hypothetical protein
MLVAIAACSSNEGPLEPDDAASAPAANGPSQDSAPSQENNAGSEEQPQVSEEDVLAMIQANWEGSAHAAAFVLDSNDENNGCAKCHSPVNWQPTLDDLPESCFSCKFELADPDPVIAEQDWEHIPCRVCHEVGRKDKVEPEIKWLEIAELDEYASVDSATELCQKCHLEEGFTDHGGIQDLGVHAGMECTSCHDAHSNQAGCLNAGCHAGVLENGSPGHIDVHAAVDCVACHDAAGMGLDFRDDGVFSTFVVLSTDEGESTFFFASHNLQLESNCDLCHFVENPYGILEAVDP